MTDQWNRPLEMARQLPERGAAQKEDKAKALIESSLERSSDSEPTPTKDDTTSKAKPDAPAEGADPSADLSQEDGPKDDQKDSEAPSE